MSNCKKIIMIGALTLSLFSNPMFNNSIVMAEAPADKLINEILEEESPVKQIKNDDKNVVKQQENVSQDETRSIKEKPEIKITEKQSVEVKDVVKEQQNQQFNFSDTANIKPTKNEFSYPKVSVIAMGRRLGDVVLELTGQTGYNIVFGPETDPNVSVVINLQDQPLDKVIDAITKYVNYGYEIQGNTITISKMISKTFSIPEVAINIPQTSAELGGDMLGGSSSSSSSGSTGFGTTGGTDFGTQNLKASVSIKKSDDKIDGRKLFEENIKKFLSPDGHYIIDWLSATLFVYDSPRNVSLVENYLNNLRKQADKQLLVEATISLVSLNKNFQFGVDWNILAKRLGGEILTDPSRNRSFSIQTSATGNITNPAITITRTASDVSAVLKALQEQGDVKVISSPYVYARNLQPVAIYSGKSIPYISNVQRTVSGQISESTTSYSIARAQDGVMLSLKAHVREDGLIDLQLVPILSSIDGFVNFNIDNNQFSNPIASIQQTLQSVTVKDGETIVIGGIKRDKKSETEQGVPLLSKIPLLGGLFRYTEDSSENAEVVIAIKVKKINL